MVKFFLDEYLFVIYSRNPIGNLSRRDIIMALDERYEIIDALHGEGGFGKVSKRRDKILERYVAVKELRMLDDAEMRNRFKREAKALAQISHPNVPAIYDVILMKIRCLFFLNLWKEAPSEV